jgi:DNA polymerase III subunit delta'
VAHSPGRLLPTIRSRCRRFPMRPLSSSIVSRLLETYWPGLSPTQTVALVALADGSIGRALDLAKAGGVELYRGILALLSREQGVDPAALHALADQLARCEADHAYRAVEELLSHLLGKIAVCAASGNSSHRSCPESDQVLPRLSARAPAARWAELREQVAASFARGEALNLDRKQTILGTFFAIERVAR